LDLSSARFCTNIALFPTLLQLGNMHNPYLESKIQKRAYLKQVVGTTQIRGFIG